MVWFIIHLIDIKGTPPGTYCSYILTLPYMESVKDNNVCKIEDNLGVKDNTEGVHRLGFQVVMIVS